MAYNCLFLKGYKCLTFNHNYYLVNPEMLALTKTVERCLRQAKLKVPLCGCRKKLSVRHPLECMFLMKYQDLNTRLH